MKKLIHTAAAIACCSGAAHAETAVTIYGTIDTGIEYVSHANASGSALVRMPSITGSIPSRWGLNGREDLGGGYQAVFTLEGGFNSDQGTQGQGGRLFGRQAWTGIASPYGTVSFGRQYTTTFSTLLANDVLGPSIYGIAALDPYIPNGRSDNSVAYLGTFGGLTVGATYSFGRDAAGTGNSPGQGTCAGELPGQPSTCRQWSAMVRYDTPNAGVAVSYDEQRGGTGAAANFFDGMAPTPITSAGDRDARWLVNGSLRFHPFKLVAGWVGRRVDFASQATPDVHTDLFYVGASHFVTPALSLSAEIYRIVNSQHDTRATLSSLQAMYYFSKRNAVYLQLAYLANSARAAYSVSSGGGGTTPAPGVGQTGAMVGLRTTF